MSRSDSERFADIIDSIDRCQQQAPYLRSGEHIAMAHDAVLRNLAVIGEAVRGLSPQTRQPLPDVPWAAIPGLRNVVVHEYFRINPDLVLDIVDDQLSALKDKLQHLQALADDLYAPVAAKPPVERSVAKIAVLAAMYGQRSGAAGEALRDLQRAYPVAMGLLDEAYAAGLARRPLRTFGGRLIRLDSALAPEAGQAVGEGWDAARGRFARNAIIQGAAAELFKAWAATVRHLVRPLGGQIVLCLHDELLVHVPEGHSAAAVEVVHRALADSARRWVGASAGVPVRFVAEVSVIHRWDEAKG